MSIFDKSQAQRDSEHEGRVNDFYKTVFNAELSYSEIELQLDIVRNDEAYLKRSHPRNKFIVAQVEALTRLQNLHEAGRLKAGYEKYTKEQEERFEEIKDLSASDRRSIIQNYGPRPGGDTTSYRQDLKGVPSVEKIIIEEFGPDPRDDPEDPDHAA